MRKQKFRSLEVWKKSMDLIEHIYRITKIFPKNEEMGLIQQLRRASNSISLNIAEGSGAESDKDFRRFLCIARRSSYELMCGIEIAGRLEYLSSNKCVQILDRCDEISAMISAFMKRLKK